MGCCACRAGAHPTVWCWLFVPQSSLLITRGPSALAKPLPGNTRGWMRSSCLVPLVWKDPGALGVQEWQEEACSVQATATAGRREEDGGSLGGRRGTGRETTQQQQRRGLEEEDSEGLLETHQQLWLPSHQAHSLAPAALHSCPRWAPAARGAAPPARGHPAATLRPRVMGYLGVGLLSLPLQEPELLLLLSEEVP